MESDLVQRLCKGAFSFNPLLQEAAEEIERLRNGALSGRESATSEQTSEVDALRQRVAELIYAKEQLQLRVLDLVTTRAKNALVTLTSEERAALERCHIDCNRAATLRGLLERLGVKQNTQDQRRRREGEP